MCGIETREEAVEICEGYDWVIDCEHGYCWDFEIEEDDPIAHKELKDA